MSENITSVRPVLKGERMFPIIWDLSVLFDAIYIAYLRVKNGQALPPGGHISLLAKLSPLSPKITIGGPFVAVIEKRDVGGMDVAFGPLDANANFALETGQFQSILTSVTTMLFKKFFESHKQWIRDNCHEDTEQWPEIFRFGWAVRNAFAHDGKIDIRDKRNGVARRPVVWAGVSLTKADNGANIIGPILEPGDLINLLFEISDELDHLGCPV